MERVANKIYGYSLTKGIRKISLTQLHEYPNLVKIYSQIKDIDGSKNFAEKVIDKVSLEQRIKRMEEVFDEIPSVYKEVVKYLIFTDDTLVQKKGNVEYKFLVSYSEASAWLEKTLYLYAELEGWPVSKRGKECSIIILENGKVEIC